MGLIQKIFGSKNQRELNKLRPNVVRINELEATYKAKSDDELKAMTAELKQKLDNGASLDDILCDAFAVVREASVRTTGMRQAHLSAKQSQARPRPRIPRPHEDPWRPQGHQRASCQGPQAPRCLTHRLNRRWRAPPFHAARAC